MVKYHKIIKIIEDKQKRAIAKIAELNAKKWAIIHECDKPGILQREWEEKMSCFADLRRKTEKSERLLLAYCDVLESLEIFEENVFPRKPSADEAELIIEKLLESKKAKIRLVKDELRSLSKAKRHRSVTHTDYVSAVKRETELQKEICEIEEQISQINIFKCIVRNVIKLPEDQTL